MAVGEHVSDVARLLWRTFCPIAMRSCSITPLSRPWNQPAALSIPVREVGAGHLPKQAVRHFPINDRPRRAARHRSNVRPRPDERVRFRRDDPRRKVVKSQAAFDVLREGDSIGRIRGRGVGGGKDENLGGSIGLLDGQREDQGRAILSAFLMSPRAFIRPQIGIPDNRSPLGFGADQLSSPTASASISARKRSGVSAAVNAC